MLASPRSNEMFNEVLQKEYSDFRYSKSHHFTLDSYSSQYSGDINNQKAINSVGIHQPSFYFVTVKKYDLSSSAEIKM